MTMSWRAPVLMLVLIAALYLAARPWLLDSLGAANIAIGVVLAAVFLSLIVAWWQARRRQYTCPCCAHVFGVSMLRNLASQNWFGRLHTICPSCDKYEWCDIASGVEE
jgi:hypothetical protein